MIIIRASHLGMCFGVRDAISLAHREAASGPVTVLGDLVHNETVLDELRRSGIQLQRRLEDVSTPTVLITAHGASMRRLTQVQERGHRLVEATCPLVRFAHERVTSLVREGFHPVIIGKHDHVEVRGLTEDLAEFDVILEEADVARLTPRERFGVAAQTTQPMARVGKLLALMRERFPKSEIRYADTICLPTKRRQQAAREVAGASSVVVVVGGAHSNNTRELVETCRRHCERVHHVQTADDLRTEWFRPDDTVGLTAGTSTPDSVINSVEVWLRQLANQYSPGASEPIAMAIQNP